MTLSCPIVRDLLPLYAENMTSAESREAVEAHLKTCPACRKALAELQTGIDVPRTVIAAPLQRIRRVLRLRWLRGVLLAACIALAAAFCVMEVLQRPYYLPCPDDLRVAESETGIYFVTDAVCDGWVSQISPEADGGYVVFLSLENTRLSAGRIDLKGEPHYLVKWRDDAHGNGKTYSRDELRAIYYSPNDGHTDAALLWGTPVADGVQSLPRLALTYYLLIAAALAVLFGVLALAFRRKRRLSRIMLCIALAPLSFCIAVLATRGFETATYSLTQELPLIGWASLALYAAALLAAGLIWDRKA